MFTLEERESISAVLIRELFDKGNTIFHCPKCGGKNFQSHLKNLRSCVTECCGWIGKKSESIPDVFTNGNFIFDIAQAVHNRGWVWDIGRNTKGSVRVRFLCLHSSKDIALEHEGHEHEAIAIAAYQVLHYLKPDKISALPQC